MYGEGDRNYFLFLPCQRILWFPPQLLESEKNRRTGSFVVPRDRQRGCGSRLCQATPSALKASVLSTGCVSDKSSGPAAIARDQLLPSFPREQPVQRAPLETPGWRPAAGQPDFQHPCATGHPPRRPAPQGARLMGLASLDPPPGRESPAEESRPPRLCRTIQVRASPYVR